MRTVHKFYLNGPVPGESTITVPDNAKMLHAGIDEKGNPCVWVEVDTDAPSRDQRVLVYGMGQEIEEGLRYVDTYHQGYFVWHVYV